MGVEGGEVVLADRGQEQAGGVEGWRHAPIIARSGGGADGAGVAGAPDGGGADDGAGVGGLDHQALADVHADVVDGARVAGVVGEEDQVAGDQAEGVDRAQAGVGGELGAGDPGDGDPGGGVGEAGQAGAVEGAGAFGAPDVGEPSWPRATATALRAAAEARPSRTGAVPAARASAR